MIAREEENRIESIETCGYILQRAEGGDNQCKDSEACYQIMYIYTLETHRESNAGSIV